MSAFNAEEFATINKMCEGETSSHKHEKWGLAADGTKFAILETTYPLKLARTIALQFVAVLQRLGIQMLLETLSEISAGDNAVLPALRAQTGLQLWASKLLPLIPNTYAARVALTGFPPDLPPVELNQKLATPTTVATINAPTLLPKAPNYSRWFLPCCPRRVATCFLQGAWVSGQQLAKDEIDRIMLKCEVP